MCACTYVYVYRIYATITLDPVVITLRPLEVPPTDPAGTLFSLFSFVIQKLLR